MLFVNLSSLYHSALFRLASLFMLVSFSATLVILEQTDEAIEQYFEDKALSFGNELLVEKLGFFEEFGAAALTQEIMMLSERNPESREIYVLLDENCNAIAGAPERLNLEFLNPDTCRRMERAGGTRIFNLPRESSGIRYQSQYDNREINHDDAVAVYEQLPTGGSLLVVLVAPEAEEARDFMDSTLAWTFTLLFCGGLTGAILLTLSVSRRLEKVNLMSREIRLGDLSRRIPLNGSGDEFDNLSMNLNAMLDRIEQVLEGSKQVTNDIAHDLRTPLTRIQTRIESLKNNRIKDDETGDALEKIGEEASALLDMFNSLLQIAGIESGRVTSAFKEVDYSQVCRDVIDLLEPVAAEKSVALDYQLEDSLLVQGDRNLLFHCATNIIENAIKYTPSGGRAFVDLKRADNYIVFQVRDEGPGIPDQEMTNVFKRFYRLEGHRGTEGYGLGLSLVQAVIDLHRGSIHLENTENGLEFIVTLSKV